jgi:hypothetical protein
MSNRVTEQINAAAAVICDQLGPLVRGEELLPFDAALARIEHAQDACLDQLAQTGLWGRENQMPSGDFWKRAGWIVRQGPLQWHAREKPHGYAGDYEMLDQIADDRIADIRHADDVLPAAFDRYFQDQAAPKAVRNRTVEIANRIVDTVRRHPDRRVKIASVGSGSAPDVRWALQALDPSETARLDVSLFDLDPHALDFAATKLDRLPQRQLQTHRVNLLRFARLPTLVTLLAEADLIFCSGLFDYLTRNDAVAMLKAFWSQLRSGGSLLVFNFSPLNPSRAYMEWFGNWYLEYRTPEAMRQLGHDAGWSDHEFAVQVEQENVNLFIEAWKR